VLTNKKRCAILIHVEHRSPHNKIEREKIQMKEFRIYIKSNENGRGINTPKMARVNYSKITFVGTEAELVEKLAELEAKGEIINEICFGCGCRSYFINGRLYK
jgi:hypothetical protein